MCAWCCSTEKEIVTFTFCFTHWHHHPVFIYQKDAAVTSWASQSHRCLPTHLVPPLRAGIAAPAPNC